MLDDLYHFYRGASGFTFLVVGLGILMQPDIIRVRKAFGALFLSLGLAFMLSWLSEFWMLPFALDNALVIAIVYAISLSTFEISLYLFGDEAVRGSRRTVYLIGAAWSLMLWLLPLLDLAFNFPVLRSNIEDSRPMALFQSLASTGIYLYPIAITVVSLRFGRWKIADWPHGPGASRAILGGIAAAAVILIVIGISLALNSRAWYRLAHTGLKFLLLLWFLFYQANPDIFYKARREIGQRHKQREKISLSEASIIAGKLKDAVESNRIYSDQELDLPSLAKAIGIPVYRLSSYFNSILGMSFSEWLNGVRIDRVKRLLIEQQDMSILDISLEAGYATKAVFNSQFQRCVGMKPSEYRGRKST